MDACIAAAVALLYANVPAVLGRLTGMPAVLGALILGLLAIPAFLHVAVLRRGVVLDRTWLLLVLFLAPLVVASALSRDLPLALAWIGTFVSEVLLVYLFLLNGVRRRRAHPQGARDPVFPAYRAEEAFARDSL